jgi:acetyl-CoA acetyltransferase family protein
MTRAPLVTLKPDAAFGRGNATMYDTTLGWRMINPCMQELYPPISLGETAENVARKYGVSREDQDVLALNSHAKAVAAQEACRFSAEIIPVEVSRPKDERTLVDRDEGPRTDTSLEKLARLRPAFVEGGSVTAGNSSQLNDGAAAVLLMSAERARQLGLAPLARFVDAASAGVDPAYMGIGPVPATRKLLARSRTELNDIDVVEMNEAFASQVIACVRELGIDEARLNPNGGAIALGHPLGASGARLVTTLVHDLHSRKLRLGLATMCVGVGQGISALFERARA